MTFDLDMLLRAGAAGAQGDPADFVVAADHFLALGQLEPAASALDRAYRLTPDDRQIAEQRRDVLERLVVVEHDLVFRYVPAGTFVMGSTRGDPDERPLHPVTLPAFWITDVPITWAAFCDLLDWEPPPTGAPRADDDGQENDGMRGFHLREANKIRRSYCMVADGEDAEEYEDEDDEDAPFSEFGQPARSWIPRSPPERRPAHYDRKPMVAVGWADAEELAARMSSTHARFALPSESQWEKAARGGRIGAIYSWGDAAPTPERCDFGHFGRFTIADPRTLPSNGYGLHGMCGGVWEWTSTLYDALAYSSKAQGLVSDDALQGRPDDRLLALNDRSADVDPALLQQPHLRVLRGGSWADGEAAVTVSVRMAREGWGWRSHSWSGSDTPNVGFRLIRLAGPGRPRPRPP
jgi:sulfatase modifying factor 1